MRILDKYITREFLRYYFPFLFFFIAIFILTDFFTSMSHLKKEANFLQVSFYYILQIPYLLIILSPLSVIISALFVTSSFGATNQFQAIQISGISGKRAILPLLTAGVIISFSTLFMDNTLVYKMNHLSYQLKEQSFTGIFESKIQKNIFVAVPPEYIFYIRSLNPRKGVMNDVLIYQNSSSPILTCAREGRWREGVWVLYQGRDYILKDEIEERAFTQKILPINKKPDYFTRKYFPPERMNISELTYYIEEYGRGGFNTRDLKAELQFKISSPFANFILMLIALPLGIMLKRGGRGASLAVGLLMSSGYYELIAFLKTLGKSGVMESFLAAWLANILFAIAGIYLLYKME